jgi:hypothetical protein
MMNAELSSMSVEEYISCDLCSRSFHRDSESWIRLKDHMREVVCEECCAESVQILLDLVEESTQENKGCEVNASLTLELNSNGNIGTDRE